jgi:hypothetical protein
MPDATPRFRHSDVDGRLIRLVEERCSADSSSEGAVVPPNWKTNLVVNHSSTNPAESLSARVIGGIGALQGNGQERAVSELRQDSSENTTEVEVLDAKERWNEYRLADGTTMRVKSVVIAVFREDNRQTAEGEPVYSMKSTLITDVRAPSLSLKPEI